VRRVPLIGRGMNSTAWAPGRTAHKCSS
jgi:hypothetical protein